MGWDLRNVVRCVFAPILGGVQRDTLDVDMCGKSPLSTLKKYLNASDSAVWRGRRCDPFVVRV